MTEEITSFTEEFLECMYRLQEREGTARTSELVKMLKVVPGTITNTVERLEEKGLVIHEVYKGVRLTEKGRSIALYVVRRHRLSERLLTDILRMNWNKVHEPACLLEHGITDEVAERIEKVLSHPKTCPHGNPIPTESGAIVEEKLEPLLRLKPGEKGIVRKITEETNETLEHIESLGLNLGTCVEVIEKGRSEEPMTIRIDHSDNVVSSQTASTIEVERLGIHLEVEK